MKKRRLQDSYEDTFQTEASFLQFTAEIIEHTAKKIKIQITFEYPGQISALGQDIFTVKFKELSLFKSASTLK